MKKVKKSKVEKSFEITNAKISFVSLVDKAANQRQFLIVKSADDERGFATLGKIVKSDAETHHITGIVYEPLVKDAHDNFMTEEEIQKAAYWFAKNGDKVDLQHDFEACESCSVVENWVAKVDFDFDGEIIKKGTWLMTVEITDDTIWESIEKGEITGFSMGGVGKYSTDDVDVEAIEKGGEAKVDEKKGIFKQLAEAFGLSVVEKGAMADKFEHDQKQSGFWNALRILEDVLSTSHWDYHSDRYVYDFEDDESKVREALEEFSEIVTELLAAPNIAKALVETAPEVSVAKAGKKMSGANKQKLNEIIAALSDFSDAVKDEEEEEPVKKEEIQAMVDEAVAKALNPAAAEPEKETDDSIEKMVEAAVEKAIAAHTAEPVAEPEAPNVEDVVNEAVKKALEPLLKAKGVPSNLRSDTASVKKESQHYLDGIL